MNVISSLLLAAIALPAAAALFVGRDRPASGRIAIFAAAAALALAAWPSFHVVLHILLPGSFDAEQTAGPIAVDLPSCASANGLCNVRFALLLDGLSVWPFIFTCLAVLAAVIIAQREIAGDVAARQPNGGGTAHYRLLLIFESGLLGLFAAGDAMLFFVFYGFSLLPFFFLAAADRSARQRAATIFFSCEAGGGQLVLLGLLAGAVRECRPSLPVFIALAAGFTIRMVSPLVFVLFSTLPKSANISAAIAAWSPAVLLALSGVYGVLRFARPLLPQAGFAAAPWLGAFAAAALISLALAAVEKVADS